MPDGQTVIELELDVRKYTRNVLAATKQADRASAAIEDIADSATDAAREMNVLGKGVKVTIKVNDAQLKTAAGDIDALDSSDPTIAIDVTGQTELAAAKSDVDAIDAADPTVAIDVTGQTELATAKADVDAIDAADPTVAVDVTGQREVSDVKADVKAIATANPTVNVDVDSNGKADILEVRDKLKEIQKLAKVQFILQGLSTAKNALAGLVGAPIVSTLGEMNAAMAAFQAASGSPATGIMRSIIQGEFSRGIAETPDQVARLAAALDNANVPADEMASALQSVYDLALVTQAPAEEIANAAQKMVAAGLSPDIASAVDALSTGFQTGANRANDLLATMDEFAPHFAGAGLTAAQSIEAINQALINGAQNGSRAGDVFKEVGIILSEQFAAGEGAALDALEMIDPTGALADTAALVATGQENGAALASGVMAGIEAGLASGSIAPASVDSMLTAIFGTPIEELGTEVFKGMDFDAILAAQFSPEATETAVAPLRNTLTSAAQELGRVLEFEIADKFRIAGQPLQDLLDNAPAKMRELAELIRGGEGIPEALEIVLEAPGLADTIHDFESGFANMIIGFLDGLAKLIAVIPGANPEPLQQTVANLATGQLPFDLMNAQTEEDVAAAIGRAWERGVTVSGFEGALEEAVTNLADEGQLIRAETLLANAEAVAATIQGASTIWQNSLGPIVLASGGEETAGFNTADLEDSRDLINEARLGFDDYATSVRKAGDDAIAASVDSIALNTQLAKSRDVANEIKPRADDLTGAYEDLETQSTLTGQELSLMAEAGVEGLGGLVTATETESPKLLAQWEGYRAMLVSVGDAAAEAYLKATALFNTTGGYTPGNTPPIGPNAPLVGMASGGMPGRGPTWVGERGPELLSFAPGASILNNETSNAIVGGLAALLSGGYGPGGSNITNANINININTQGQAAAIGAGDRVSSKMRGMFG